MIVRISFGWQNKFSSPTYTATMIARPGKIHKYVINDKTGIKLDLFYREIRGCLVVRFADRIFGGIQRALFFTEAPQTSTVPYVVEQSS